MGPMAEPSVITLDGSEPEESSGSEDDEGVTFAPDDLPLCLVQPKTNTFGMGYSGLDRRPVLSGHINLFEEPQIINARIGSTSKPRGIRGQAFGVGAFEAEDEDIYVGDDMSRYDFSLETAVERKDKRRLEAEQKQKQKRKQGQAGECLEGFQRAKHPMCTVRNFPPPKLPKDFRPQHVVKQSRFSEPTVEAPGQHRRQGLGRHDLTSDERSVLIGDAPARSALPTPSSSQEVEASTKPEPPAKRPSRFSDFPPPLKLPEKTPVEKIDVVPAELKSGQFNPFLHDAEKQKRYCQFLTLSKQNKKELLSGVQPATMTEWERDREKSEFEQAARLFQPLAGPISERFVSSATLLGSEEVPTLEPVPVEASVSAAKMKLFGRMTRTQEPWQPCSLLCKRFNVPEPNSGAATLSSTRRRPGFSVFDFMAVAPQNSMPADIAEIPLPPSEPSVARERLSQPLQQIHGETSSAVTSEPQLPEIPSDPKERVDLYKAIFLSSSEGEEEEEVTPEPAKPPSAPPPKPSIPEPPPPKPRVRSPPRGVFAMLDRVSDVPGSSVAAAQNHPPDPDLYGPALPSLPPDLSAAPAEPVVTPAAPFELPRSDSKWVEKTNSKREKHGKKHKRSRSKEKKKHKEKKSKKRKKEKHKKRSKSTSSTSSSD